jgi:hypothetical protein
MIAKNENFENHLFSPNGEFSISNKLFSFEKKYFSIRGKSCFVLNGKVSFSKRFFLFEKKLAATGKENYFLSNGKSFIFKEKVCLKNYRAPLG